MTQQTKRTERLTLVLTEAQRKQVEAIRLQLEQEKGRRASLSAVATALLERGLRAAAA